MTAPAFDTHFPLAAHPTAPSARRVTLASARRRYPQHSVPSPCIGVCKMDDTQGWCAGCFRTLAELTAWSGATDAAKLAVWSLVERRQG